MAFQESPGRSVNAPRWRILLTGATGFIGGRLLGALRQAGHEVRCAGRHRPDGAAHWVEIDMARTPDAAAWREPLQGIDVVINAVGIFRESGSQRFEALHAQAPSALFDACVQAGVRRVVQLSALGADEHARTAYHLSKRKADEHLLSLPLQGVVLQPSLVFAADGPSAGWFLSLATLPLLPLPGGGGQCLQPVHVDDLVAAVLRLLEQPTWTPGRLACVGPRAITLEAYLEGLRQGLHMPPVRTWNVPSRWVAWAARVGDHLPRSLLDSASWQMLQRGNQADASDFARLLRRLPRDPSRFIDRACAAALRAQARQRWLRPPMRAAIAAVWLATAVVSAGLFPVAESLQLLQRAGVPQALQAAALYGACALDAAFGVLTLAPLRARHLRWLWLAQAGLMAGYTAIISWRLPEFWLHPYGPMTKNLPMLALLAWLYTTEEDAR